MGVPLFTSCGYRVIRQNLIKTVTEKFACTHNRRPEAEMWIWTRSLFYRLSVQSLATLQAWWVVSAHFERSNLGLIKSDLQNACTAWLQTCTCNKIEGLIVERRLADSQSQRDGDTRRPVIIHRLSICLRSKHSPHTRHTLSRRT